MKNGCTTIAQIINHGNKKMSLPYGPDVVYTKKTPLIPGKKSFKIELYQANRWKSTYSRGSKIVASPPMIRDDELDLLYRLMINGKWYHTKGFDMSFHSMKFVMEMLAVA